MTRRKPGPGWKWISGPVWEHTSGIQLHVGGLMQFPNGEYLSANTLAECQDVDRAVRIAGGNRRRGLMLWALEKLEVT